MMFLPVCLLAVAHAACAVSAHPAMHPAAPTPARTPLLSARRWRAGARAAMRAAREPPSGPPPPPLSAAAVDRELLTIAGPALLALVVDPIATLVDTACAGSLGATHLAALGSAASLIGLVSKTFNFLLSVTTSAVAAEAPLELGARGGGAGGGGGGGGAQQGLPPSVLELAVSALALATAIGLVLAVAVLCGAGALLRAAGIGADSAVYAPALGYLRARALGLPFMLGGMALVGVSRGLRDTRTPLLALCASSAANAALDLVAVRALRARAALAGLGAATAASQLVGVLVLAAALGARVRRAAGAGARVRWPPPSARLLRSMGRSAAILSARTFCGLLAFARAATVASGASALSGAAHAVVFQLWLSAALTADALAIASQAMLAAALARASAGAAAARDAATLIAARTARLTALLGALLAAAMACARGPMVRALSSDGAVHAAACAVWPLAVLSQPLNAGAFAVDGLLYGAQQFGWAAASVIGGAAPALALMHRAAAALSAGRAGAGAAAAGLALRRVWLALGVYMGVRLAIGAGRLLVLSAAGWGTREHSNDVADGDALVMDDGVDDRTDEGSW